jgi:RNA polymerase sigma factor (sigma-70 family)
MIMLEKLDDSQFALTCKFRTFLYCICENLWQRVLVKRQAANNYLSRRDEPETEKDFTELMDHRMYDEIFQEVFKTLDPVGKKILKMYWKDMSPQEIADNLGYTNGYVRKKKSEAQNELIEKVKKHPAYIKIKNTEMAAREIVN